MNIKKQVKLSDYLTMRIGGNAKYLVIAETLADIKNIYHQAKTEQMPIFILGGGSNVLAKDDDFNGFILLNRLSGFETIEQTDQTTTIKIGAGEKWDRVVEKTVQANLSGIEALSAIPGMAGAAPVQNIGAYGQELADTFKELEAYDSQTGEVVILSKEDCQFGYRHSIFRGEHQGRYCILNITLQLSKAAPRPPFYDALQKYLDQNNITDYQAKNIRTAVMAIRQNKLPDPKILPNCGSFFKNAIISAAQYQRLVADFPDIPSYPAEDNHYKIPTGWLIDRAELKGEILHGMRIYSQNALVLINESADSYQNLSLARQQIIDRVAEKFHIQIEQEPLEIG